VHLRRETVHVRRDRLRVCRDRLHVRRDRLRVCRDRLHVRRDTVQVRRHRSHVRRERLHLRRDRLHVRRDTAHAYREAAHMPGTPETRPTPRGGVATVTSPCPSPFPSPPSRISFLRYFGEVDALRLFENRQIVHGKRLIGKVVNDKDDVVVAENEQRFGWTRHGRPQEDEHPVT
jgi:hypothetical protein